MAKDSLCTQREPMVLMSLPLPLGVTARPLAGWLAQLHFPLQVPQGTTQRNVQEGGFIHVCRKWKPMMTTGTGQDQDQDQNMNDDTARARAVPGCQLPVELELLVHR